MCPTSRSSIPGLLLCLLASGVIPRAQAQFIQQGPQLPYSGGAGGVALSADGNTAIVGDPDHSNNTGRALIFTRSNSAWTQQGGALIGSGAVPSAWGTGVAVHQGIAVALSADGNTALIGGRYDGGDGRGAAWVFTRSNGVWSQQGAKLSGNGAASNSRYGSYVALSADGNTALLGSESSGPYAFTRSNGVWSQQGKIETGGCYALPVALSADSNTALVGDPCKGSFGSALVFTRSGGSWSQQATLEGAGAILTGVGVAQGLAVALSADGNTAMVGGPWDNHDAGAAWIFTRSNGTWSQQSGKLTAGTGASTFFGGCVSLSGDGDTALSSGSGTISVLRRSQGVWTEQSKLATWGCPAISTDGSTMILRGSPAQVYAQPHFTFSTPASAAGGAPFNFIVSAYDANNLLLAGYPGTVRFTSTDSAATLPADSPLVAGVRNLPATLRTGGNQTITAGDRANSGVFGTSSPINVAPANPRVVSAAPAAGSGAAQSFSFQFSDPAGWQELSVVNVLINNFLDGRQSCYLAYSVPDSRLYLVPDSGGGLLPGLALNAPGTTSNSQCAVAETGSSATGSGSTLTLTLNLSFTTGFAGNKVVYMAARDTAGNNSGWVPMGVWQVPGASAATTTAVGAMNPARGAGAGQTAYTFTFSDSKGSQDLGVANILVNTALDGRHACYLAYSRPYDVLYLVNDPGDALLPGQSLSTPGTLQNSQCTVSWGINPGGAGNNTLALTLNIGFTAGFGPNLIFYLAARDGQEANNTGWQSMGTWTVQ
jgi:hypothetical protein